METNIIVIALFLIAAVFLLIFLRRRPGGAAKIAVLEERIAASEEEKKRLREEGVSQKNEIQALNENLEVRDRSIANLERQLAVAMKELENEREQAGEKIQLLKGAREELANHFKVLANSILDEKSRVFKEQNKTGIDEILSPLREKLGEFQKKVQENYETEGKERHSLRNEVHKLMEMNHRLSQEASNLTNALKGDNKSQGNWGEMILERILEVSGLRKGEEYTVQESHTRSDGSRVQPDVVIHLPENRRMVIDAKVSLNAYDSYVNSEDEAAREAALKAHIQSVRTHVKGLASKEYHKLHGDQSPDFVIMFIPIEPAFLLALSKDAKLWEDGWKSNVLLVSSSTLLFVLRIVMQLWKQEHRSRNALDIAQRGAALYDKLVNFVEDFDTIGVRIAQAGKTFESARGKLSSGRGNVIRQAQMLKELGIMASKQLPESYVEDTDSPEAPPELQLF
ncbi:MAG: hypothetical protein B0D92_00840 [Spirochaeta sp. LUC14_002_19_P3]|nr:MAG: hypothetical protein B0D92_00840 [Spirochaeta sp. LUC14_002_19_P3]